MVFKKVSKNIFFVIIGIFLVLDGVLSFVFGNTEKIVNNGFLFGQVIRVIRTVIGISILLMWRK